MKAAGIILAAVSALLVGDSLSLASHIVRVSERYEVDTPAPSGQRSCFSNFLFTMDFGGRGTLFFELLVFEGEAELRLNTSKPGFELRDGLQPGCPLFLPPGPTRGKFPLVGPGNVILGSLLLDVHAHPGPNCLVGGHARGVVYVEHNVAPEFHPSLVMMPVRCSAPQQAEEDD